MPEKKKIREIIERISPIIIDAGDASVTLGLSKRFMLFELFKKMSDRIEEDPYLNFISILKYYKVMGNFIEGTVHEFYRDIKKPYFRDFFFDKRLYRSIKKDIEWIHSINKDIKVALNKRGLVIYDNYKKNDFNILMLTIHSGHWVPENIIDKHVISAKERAYEEDVGTHKIYGRLVLKNNGIWIDNKLSRYAIDFNRKEEEAIYKDHQEKWLKHVWKKQLDIAEKRWLFECYERFYLTLESLIDTWRFNVIFDGHSMSDADDRPDISFGTTYVPRFYIPIVRQMEKKLKKKGYCSIDENTPYEGGYVNQVLKEKFPDVFILSMEINKKLYHIPNTTKPDDKKVENLSQVLSEIFAFK